MQPCLVAALPEGRANGDALGYAFDAYILPISAAHLEL